jgi:hypothetical protein
MTAQRDSTGVDWLSRVTCESRVYHNLRNGMQISLHNLSYSGCGIPELVFFRHTRPRLSRDYRPGPSKDR